MVITLYSLHSALVIQLQVSKTRILSNTAMNIVSLKNTVVETEINDLHLSHGDLLNVIH